MVASRTPAMQRGDSVPFLATFGIRTEDSQALRRKPHASSLAFFPSEKQCRSLGLPQIPQLNTCLAWECPLMKRGRPFDPPTLQPAAHLSGCPSSFRLTQPTYSLPTMHRPTPTPSSLRSMEETWVSIPDGSLAAAADCLSPMGLG